jgi:hypothetical protein
MIEIAACTEQEPPLPLVSETETAEKARTDTPQGDSAYPSLRAFREHVFPGVTED